MSIQKNEIRINGSNDKPILLDITFDREAGKRPVIIYAHGFNGFKNWGNFDLIARQFVAAGFTFVKFNFSHNGTSPEQPEDFVDLEAFGENNYTKELYDLEKVIDWVQDKEQERAAYIDARKTGLIGHSMGGGISILKTAEDSRIKALVTWAAISQCKTPWGSWTADKIHEWAVTGVEYYTNGRTQQQMPLYYQLYEDYQNHRERLDILKAAGEISVPFLICHGTEDTGVSVDNAYALQEANAGSELFTVSSDHVFGRKHPWTGTHLPDAMQAVTERNISFFTEKLS